MKSWLILIYLHLDPSLQVTIRDGVVRYPLGDVVCRVRYYNHIHCLGYDTLVEDEELAAAALPAPTHLQVTIRDGVVRYPFRDVVCRGR